VADCRQKRKDRKKTKEVAIMTPYDVLGVSPQADDAEVRSAYLTLVRRHPPERDAKLFSEINQAYQTLKDRDSRLRYFLFDTTPGLQTPADSLKEAFLRAEDRAPLDAKTMRRYLQKCATW
jgi:curved DNA-binding protein CbpA